MRSRTLPATWLHSVLVGLNALLLHLDKDGNQSAPVETNTNKSIIQ